MRIEERLQTPVSTGFIKADLHIHTPESECYADPLVSAQQIVDAAFVAQLGVIAITDHNSANWVDDIRSLAAAKGIVVFPGTEMSTRSGHILALFDPETPVQRIDGLLDNLGITTPEKGDGAVAVKGDAGDIFARIDEYGGIIIASHIERWPSGFLQTSERRQVKMNIHNSRHLAALEITQPQNKSLWNRGLMRDYPRPLACVQGSDAHSPEEIGRRATFLKLSAFDLQGLRLAFADFQSCVKFPGETDES